MTLRVASAAPRDRQWRRLRIELSHWPACLTAFGRELSIGMCSGFVRRLKAV
jgi:hypothetical protein